LAGQLHHTLGLTAASALALVEAGQPRSAAAGTVVFRPGQMCAGFLIVVAGELVVRAIAADGRDIQLYRVRPGETCVQTLQCLAQGQAYSGEGVVTAALTGLLVPTAAFDGLLARLPDWRAQVLSSIAARLDALSRQVTRLAFASLPQRLAREVLDLSAAGASDVIATTHEGLAHSLGVTREAVSRALAGLERTGLVALGRGQVRIVDRAGLERAAAAF
jgi:CRP/FNR family transcriptional regulator